MDKGTILGLLAAVGALLGGLMLEGGNPVALIGPSAAIIVVGGTLAATLVAFPFERVLRLPVLIKKALFEHREDEREIVELFVKLAEKARREGLLALEADARQIQDPFIQKGVMLAVDGVDAEVIRSVLEVEMASLAERHEAGYSMLEAMGGYAPTMGILGTVMGMVHVLSHLSEPEQLGEQIAVAFIATLYGVATANLVYLPLGGKLKQKSKHELALRQLALEGVLAVQAGDNPRIVREKLEAFLPPRLRSGGESDASTAGARAA
jgi:chemotaxis protein MotA